jgi:hypothetical protein
MKAYLVTTSTIFLLILVAHVLRVFAEGPRTFTDPWFLGMTLLAAGLCAWGWRLLLRLPRAET